MSELKRVAPQTLEFSGSLNNDTKKEKKGDKDKQKNEPTFRFELIIDHTNDNGYTEFNYSHLLKSAEKKRSKESKCVEENAVNGLDPFNDDDDDKLREMAKRLEAKYGTTTSIGKNRKNHGDDVDLGAGYDENDSFIDNTDAYDEVVPEGVTTALGGFYINSGPLEFSVKAAERNSLSNQNHNNNNDDDSSESSEDDGENSNGPSSRRRDRGISSSSDDDTEDHSEEPVAKKSKLEENGDKKSNHDNVIKKRKKIIAENDVDNLNKNKNQDDKQNQMEIDIISPPENDDDKKLKTDIRRHKDKKFDIKKFIKKPHVNGIDDKKLDNKKLGGKDSTIDDAIESVVNDGKIEDESSRDTLDSGKSRCIAGTSSECEDVDKSECPLPDNLSEKTKEIIENFKKEIKLAKERKTKISEVLVSSVLISLEVRMREKESSAVRSQVYGHLAPFFPCSKLTLVNRAKKLCLARAEDSIKEPLNRLKTFIDDVMPSAIERYNKECQRVAEEKALDQSPSDADSSEVDDKSSSDKLKTPRRRFPWSSDAKKLVFEIAEAWRDYYKIRKPRKESVETFVASFMESKVLPLWPSGWMKFNILMKYSQNEQAKRKQKKQRDQSNSNTVAPSIVTNSSSSLIMDVNSVSQERVKSPSNIIKNTCDNPVNYSMTSPSRKSTTDIVIERSKHSGSKHHKDKIRDNNTSGVILQDGSLPAKISVVPTSQLMAQKSSKNSGTHSDKFNPMDLTSTSLSITPVNDYQKSSKSSSDVKKDVVSITPYSELNTTSESLHSTTRPETMSSSSSSAYSMSNQSSKPVSLKQRILQDSSTDIKGEKKQDERDLITEQIHKTEHRDKKRNRWQDDKHESKKRKKDNKIIEHSQQQLINQDVAGNTSQQLLTKDEQEQRQIEETEAATNFLSQIINDDLPRSTNDNKRKDAIIDESINSMIQASEEEKNAHEVMKKLKELQELTEMKYSPSHSPFQKPKSSNQYVGYSDDYHRIYHKKEDKLRLSKEDQW